MTKIKCSRNEIPTDNGSENNKDGIMNEIVHNCKIMNKYSIK